MAAALRAPAPAVSKLGLDKLDHDEEAWWNKHLSHRSNSTEAGSAEGSRGTGSSTPSASPSSEPVASAPAMYSAARAAEARREAAKDGNPWMPQTPSHSTAQDSGLAAASASGDVESVKQMLMAGTHPDSLGPDGTTPLCAAAMWGHPKVVAFLLSAGANPNLPNKSGSRPTPLHAAALQEHGKICMQLLSAGADPLVVDTAGASPSDFASCSEALWPHFSAKGCERISKASLAARGVIRKASSTLEQELGGAENAEAQNAGLRGLLPEFSRPGSAYVVTSHFPPRPGSSMGRSSSLGSLVAPLSRTNSRGGSRSGSRPNSRGKLMNQTIDILGDGLCELPSRPGSRAGQKGASGLRKSNSLASLGL